MTLLKTASPAELAAELRRRGHIVVTFGPGDMEGYGDAAMHPLQRIESCRKVVEDRLVSEGWDILGEVLGQNTESLADDTADIPSPRA